MHIPPNWGTFGLLIVSFLVFWFIFSRIFFRPFLDLLSKRERRFKDLSEQTETLIKQAKAAEEARENRLAAVRSGLPRSAMRNGARPRPKRRRCLRMRRLTREPRWIARAFI